MKSDSGANINREHATLRFTQHETKELIQALEDAVYLLGWSEEDMQKKAGVYRVVTALEKLKEKERMSGDHERISASDYTAHRCPDTAHRCPDWDGLMIDCNDDEYQCCTCPQYNGKRKWDYLTYEEMREIVDTHAIAVVPVMMELAEAIEAKVKEKNA